MFAGFLFWSCGLCFVVWHYGFVVTCFLLWVFALWSGVFYIIVLSL